MQARRLISVEGVVQGVGFRPYVHRLAVAHALRGFVRNDARGVLIDVEGERGRVEDFCRSLTVETPDMCAVTAMRVEPAPPQDYATFAIVASDHRGAPDASVTVPPDAGTCEACLAELFDPANRRFGHPFITCTACGPRFTVVRQTPYDRERTTMAAFPLCAACQREYDDPHDRRFHAESIACLECGPTVLAYAAEGHARWHWRDAIECAASALRDGQVVAIKALGGFHLACDATNESSVNRLRRRKHRPAKPFAMMVRDIGAAEAMCRVSAAERVALLSRARPVVLLEQTASAHVAPSVAPGSTTLGIMLPSTPLHHLILDAVGRPLVMTSGNRGGEPVVIDDLDALAALGNVADVFLTHDRAIAARCDDSVVRHVAGAMRPVRRARGLVPQAVSLARHVPIPVLAVGGHLKNTICVAHGTAAHLSAHVGDLDTLAAHEAMRRAIRDTLRVAGVRPGVIAHDLHPEYASTRIAESLADEEAITRRVPVQHHHAHVAACVAEHQVRDPVIGVVFDGAGLGTDGAIWGGEFLVVDGARFGRRGHLSYVPLPGGDAAARRPWRSALAHLSRVGASTARHEWHRPPSVPEQEWHSIHQLIAHPGQPRTSSIGRLFDAVASLIGLCHVSSFEGEAAMALESAAAGRIVSRYPVPFSDGATWMADPAEIIAGVLDDVVRGRDRADIAAAFHGALRDLVVRGCDRVREESGLATVVLSGGVFANALLTHAVRVALDSHRFDVLIPRTVPCNDGGLSLGQAYVAACVLEEEDPCA